jgi:WD40 repeat protein
MRSFIRFLPLLAVLLGLVLVGCGRDQPRVTVSADTPPDAPAAPDDAGAVALAPEEQANDTKPGTPARDPEPTGKPWLVLEVGGHTAPISEVLFTHDSKELITVSKDKTVRFWDAASGKMLRTLRPPIGPGRQGELYAAALSRDDKILAVGGFGLSHGVGKNAKWSRPVYLIDVESGQMLRVLPGNDLAITSLAFSRDGKTLASGSWDGAIRTWDVEKGQALKTLKGHAAPVTSLAFSRDGKRLLSAGCTDTGKVADRAARLWSLETGETLAQLAGPHKHPVTSVAWSPDGNHLATGGVFENYVVVWDADGKQPKKHTYTAYSLKCLSLSFTPNSKAVVFSAIDSWRCLAYKLDAATGKELARYVDVNYFESEDVPSGPAAISPDGKFVAAADDRHHRIHLYDGRSAEPLRECGVAVQPPSFVAWVKEGNGDCTRVVWRTTQMPKDYKYEDPIPRGFCDRAFDLAKLEPIPVPAEGKDVHFERNRWGFGRQYLDWGGGVLRLVRDKKMTGVELEPRQGAIVGETVSFVGPDRAVFGTNDVQLDLYDVSDKGKGRHLGPLAGFNGSLSSIAVSPDSHRYILGGGEDQLLHLWDPQRMRPNDESKVWPGRLMSLFVAAPRKGSGPRARLASEWIAWTPEGYYAASGGGERLMGWHLSNGPDQMATFHPASRFRPKFYRPDVMTRLLKEGSLAKALKAADEARGDKPREAFVIDMTKVLPPTVAVKTDPAGNGQLKVSAEARPHAEPITALQLLIDERPWVGPDGKLAEVTFTRPPYTATWTVELPAGDHPVRVLARTASSLGSSPNERGMVRDEGPAPRKAEKPALYVLAVGVDAYPGLPRNWQLGGAVNDATLLKETFDKYSSPLFRKIEPYLVTDRTAADKRLPTKQGILDGLKWLRQKMTRDDVGVFFFAGHGVQDEQDREYYLLPRDGDPKHLKDTALSRPEIKRQMQVLPGRVLVLLDACNAGAIGLLFDDLSRELTDEDCGVVVMGAARPRESALEDHHGFFSISLIEGLSGKASKRNGAVYLHDLQGYVVNHVLDLSKEKQHPVTVAPPWLGPIPLSKP